MHHVGIQPSNWKIAKVITQHKAGKPKDLVGNCRSNSPTSCVSKPLIKLQNTTTNLKNNKMAAKKKKKNTRELMITYLNCLKQLIMVSTRFIALHISFFYVKKTFDQVIFDEFLFKLTSVGLHRKLIRWISNFFYQRILIILIITS